MYSTKCLDLTGGVIVTVSTGMPGMVVIDIAIFPAAFDNHAYLTTMMVVRQYGRRDDK